MTPSLFSDRGILALIFVAFSLLQATLTAADGSDAAVEIADSKSFGLVNSLNLAHCKDSLEKDSFNDRALMRRSDILDAHNQRHDLSLRDVDEVLDTDHEDNSVSMNSSRAEILASREDGCVLMPGITEGPFYIEGQYLREDLIDEKPGILIYIDLQIMDTDSCKPVADQYVEIWLSISQIPNATGVYSGVATDRDPFDRHTTFGRGISTTDRDGAVWFRTRLPGPCNRRTPHVHIMTHHPEESESLANDTLQSNVATHAGQLYFDQKLVDAVRGVAPYDSNERGFARNEDDPLFRYAAEVSDPVLSYFFIKRQDDVELYGKVEEGLIAWKVVGVNMRNTRKLDVAGTFHPPDEELDA